MKWTQDNQITVSRLKTLEEANHLGSKNNDFFFIMEKKKHLGMSDDLLSFIPKCYAFCCSTSVENSIFA